MKIELKGRIGADNAAALEQELMEQLDRKPDEPVELDAAKLEYISSSGLRVLLHVRKTHPDMRITAAALDERVRRLMGFGLRGVEAFYSGFSAELRGEALSLADRYGLYVTAGSDHHGTNKSVRLGDTGLGEANPWPEGLQRFLKDAGVYVRAPVCYTNL